MEKLFGIHSFLIIKKLLNQTQTMNSGMLLNKPTSALLSFVSISDYATLLHYQSSFLRTSDLEGARKFFSDHMDDAENKVFHTTSPVNHELFQQVQAGTATLSSRLLSSSLTAQLLSPPGGLIRLPCNIQLKTVPGRRNVYLTAY